MEYRLSRLQPPDGFLKSYKLPITYKEILDDVIKIYAGGKYKIEYFDGSKHTKAKTFEITGKPARYPKKRLPRRITMKCKCSSADLFNFGCTCGGV